MEDQKKGFRLLIVVGILWMVILFISTYYKTLFVAETGHLGVIGIDLFVFLMLGLFCRLKLLKDILVIMFIFQSLFLYIFMSMDDQTTIQYLAYLLLIALSLIIAAILNNSDAVKAYFNKDVRKLSY